VALATADKLGTVSPWLVADLADVTHVVTDGDEAATAQLEQAGVAVVRA
jgi:DeoR/GlpR family transcriptional regulator of sugar metabolism